MSTSAPFCMYYCKGFSRMEHFAGRVRVFANVAFSHANPLNPPMGKRLFALQIKL